MASNNDFFKTFCKISKAFGSTMEADDLLALIVKSAVETMAGKAACLFLADREKDVYVEKPIAIELDRMITDKEEGA